MNDGENTSGTPDGALPPGVEGFSWAAFLMNWIWGIGNQVWIALIALIPLVGIIMVFVLGFKGREWAWRARKWRSVEHFNSVQKNWVIAWFILFFGLFVLGIGSAIFIPNFVKYQEKAQQQSITP